LTADNIGAISQHEPPIGHTTIIARVNM